MPAKHKHLTTPIRTTQAYPRAESFLEEGTLNKMLFKITPAMTILIKSFDNCIKTPACTYSLPLLREAVISFETGTHQRALTSNTQAHMVMHGRASIAVLKNLIWANTRDIYSERNFFKSWEVSRVRVIRRSLTSRRFSDCQDSSDLFNNNKTRRGLQSSYPPEEVMIIKKI